MIKEKLIESFKKKENIENLKSIEKLIICGGSIKMSELIEEIDEGSEINKEINHKALAKSYENIKLTDQFLNRLGNQINLILMPNDLEPSSGYFPQRPIDCRIFPQSKSNKGIKYASNPYLFSINNINLLGFSNQLLKSVKSYTNKTDDIEIITETIEYGHYCPCCPDTIRGFPFKNTDPFLIESLTTTPNIIFHAGAEKFSIRKLELTKNKVVTLITIPDFVKSNSIILVDPYTSEAIEFLIE